MITSNENGKFSVRLCDDGTLDTVLEVYLVSNDTHEDLKNKRQIRFSQEHASQYRDEKGELTQEGFATLADEAVEEYLDILANEAYEEATGEKFNS